MANAESEEKRLSELAVQLITEANAGHVVAQETANPTLCETKHLLTRNCYEPCLQVEAKLQTQCKKNGCFARKNVSKVKYQKAGFVNMG